MVEALNAQTLSRYSRASLDYLLDGFRLVEGAPKPDADRAPYILKGTVDLLGELASRVKSGAVSTEGKVSSIGGLPLSIDFFAAKEVLRDTDAYLIDARVGGGMLAKVVESLRTLGFDAIGLTRKEDNGATGFLAVRGGFTDLQHLKSAEIKKPVVASVELEGVPSLHSPGAPGAETYGELTVPKGARQASE